MPGCQAAQHHRIWHCLLACMWRGIEHTGSAFEQHLNQMQGLLRVCSGCGEVHSKAALSLASMPAAHALRLRPAGLQALEAFKREDFVGVCGFSSLDWVTSDFADCYSGAIHLCKNDEASMQCLQHITGL